MTFFKRGSSLLASVAVALGCVTSVVSASSDDDDELTGRFRVGYRGVSVGGEEGKYQQHVNLDQGPRIFEIRFDYVPVGALSDKVDRISFDIDHFGGDPFETLRFDMAKFGKYRFGYERSKSTYFYQDIILPAGLVDPSLDAEGDFTSFNFDRVRDHASLDLTLAPRASLNFDFSRYTRHGDGTTQLDIQREVFELERPVDEKNNEFDIAFQYKWDKASLVLQEHVRDYENAYEIFLPGGTLGTNTDNASELSFFFLDQPYALESFQHTVRANLTPTPQWLIRLSGSVENLNLDGEASERSAGVTFAGAPFTTDVEGLRDIGRDTIWVDADVSYLLNERASLVGGLWRRDANQSGDGTWDDTPLFNLWDTTTTGLEGGVQYALSTDIVVTGGLRYESRSVDHGQSEDEPPSVETRKTTHAGFFLAGQWSPGRVLDFNGELETGSYDDPFTLAAPTSRLRLRLRAKAKLQNGVRLDASYTGRRIENDNRPPGQLSTTPNWESDRDSLSARIGYRKKELDFSGGYSLIRVNHAVDQTVSAGAPALFPILFESDANFIDARLRYRFDPQWRVGADARWYDNAGSFAIRRNDVRAYVELTVTGGYLLNLGYRYVDYEEKTFGFNDYDANIVEASIGYAW